MNADKLLLQAMDVLTLAAPVAAMAVAGFLVGCVVRDWWHSDRHDLLDDNWD